MTRSSSPRVRVTWPERPGHRGEALGWALVTAAALAGCTATPSEPSPETPGGDKAEYTMTSLEIRIDVGYPLRINNSGQVAGTSTCAFLWDPDGGVTDLCSVGGFQSQDEPSVVDLNANATILGRYLGPGDEWMSFLWSPSWGPRTLNGRGISLNDLGQVAGTVEVGVSADDPEATVTHGKVWGPRGGDSDLGEGSTASINASGQVVGGSWTGSDDESHEVFLWDPETGKTSLVAGVGGDTWASKINDQGHVIGTVDNNSTEHAVFWGDDGMVDLGTLAGDTSSRPMDLNERGQVVGISESAEGEARAFIWMAESGMEELTTGHAGDTTVEDINEAGQVVLNTIDGEGAPHAYLWDPEVGIIDLSALAGGPSWAEGVNDRGDVVGHVPSSCPDAVLGLDEDPDDCPHKAIIWSPSTSVRHDTRSG